MLRVNWANRGCVYGIVLLHLTSKNMNISWYYG